MAMIISNSSEVSWTIESTIDIHEKYWKGNYIKFTFLEKIIGEKKKNNSFKMTELMQKNLKRWKNTPRHWKEG